MKTLIYSIILVFILVFNCKAQLQNPYSIIDNFIPSGYMGDVKNISIVLYHTDDSRPDSICTKITLTPGDSGWGGVYWQYTENNWCKDFINLSKFKKLTFYVRGDIGGEVVKFKIGQRCGDSYVSNDIIRKINNEWTQVVIDLQGKDLSRISGVFCWFAAIRDCPKCLSRGYLQFYLDDVQLEE